MRRITTIIQSPKTMRKLGRTDRVRRRLYGDHELGARNGSCGTHGGRPVVKMGGEGRGNPMHADRLHEMHWRPNKNSNAARRLRTCWLLSESQRHH